MPVTNGPVCVLAVLGIRSTAPNRCEVTSRRGYKHRQLCDFDDVSPCLHTGDERFPNGGSAYSGVHVCGSGLFVRVLWLKTMLAQNCRWLIPCGALV